MIGAEKKADQILIRKCNRFEDFQACVELQKAVWRFDDVDVVPLRMFIVAQKIGGQVLGAYDGEQMVGFALSIPGSRNGRLYLHSHMLAVRDAYRNYGLGRRLKLAQRDDAIQRGFELMEWTFDPMEIKNAYLNIEKLGAIARRYNVNQYGQSSSPLQGGLPTDRLVAEWWLKSKRVTGLLDQGKPLAEVDALSRIEVPAQVYEWKAKDDTRQLALQVHQRNREQFLDAVARGYAVLRYERDAAGNGAFLLGRWEEDWYYGPPI